MGNTRGMAAEWHGGGRSIASVATWNPEQETHCIRQFSTFHSAIFSSIREGPQHPPLMRGQKRYVFVGLSIWDAGPRQARTNFQPRIVSDRPFWSSVTSRSRIRFWHDV